MEDTRDLKQLTALQHVSILEDGTSFQGKYRILSLLGTGGFGQVYRARQKSTGQDVAIKVIQPLAADTPTVERKLMARFSREMQLCAELHHPNIVRLIDSGEANQRPFTVFAFVPGDDLSTVLRKEKRLDPVEAAHLMCQVLDALGAAHAREMVHRDLKPGNIMITNTGARRNAMVLDFGIGVYIDAPLESDMTTVTESKDLLGTPAYSAPEQLRGAGPSTRSDLYSWGLVFLECLTGQRVMSGTSLSDVLYKQLGPEPIPLPGFLADHPLGQILGRVMEKDVDLRQVTANGLLRDMDACEFTSLRSVARPTERMQQVGSEQTLEAPPRSGDEPTTDRSGDAFVWSFGVCERHQLTVVDCLFPSGSSGSLDLDDLDSLVHRRMTLCAEMARKHQGCVGRAHGERHQIYFGYPAAREDDALRAARAALEMVRSIGKQGDSEQCVQIGIHGGEVITRQAEEAARLSLEDVVGLAPKVAALLGDRAEPDTVLISAAIQQLLQGRFDATPAGELRLAPDRSLSIFRLGEEVEDDTTSEAATRLADTVDGV